MSLNVNLNLSLNVSWRGCDWVMPLGLATPDGRLAYLVAVLGKVFPDLRPRVLTG
jgi:hypothetical protein